MEHCFRLAPFGTRFWTREPARRIRPQAEELLEDMNPGEILVLDMKKVEAFDFSFANEFFGKLLLATPKEFPGRFVIVEHLTLYTRENLTAALESLKLIMIERKGKTLRLLGKAGPAYVETFDVIRRSKHPTTAAALKDALGINLSAMNERLTKLASLGLVYRRRVLSGAGREQFEYTVLG